MSNNVNAEKCETTSVIAGMTIGERIQFFAKFTRFIDTNLIDEIDFVPIENSKPCLLASGVKKLLDFLSLLVRVEDIVCTEISDMLSYEVEIALVDTYSGVLRGKGKAICSSEEEKYKYSSRDTIYSKAKHRAVTIAILQVACLYEKFGYKDDIPKPVTAYRQSKAERPATVKQLDYLCDLIKHTNTNIWAVNEYVQRHYGIKDFHNISISAASLLIQKFLKIHN